VVFEPRDGGGSCFTLRLPVMGSANDYETKVLVVEDDPHILLGLEEVLRSDGFDVAVCNRGDQAIDAVKKHRPALIVLDVMLPG